MTFDVRKGPLYFIRRIEIGGNTITVDPVIRREIPMRPGAYYNSVDEETPKRRLQNLRYLKEVQVSG